MAKLSRSALKGIVKECLVEILSEGIGSTEASINETVNRKPPKRSRGTRKNQRSPLDTVTFDNKVNEAVSDLTDDPIMASIFADTAKTTLQEQYAAGQPGGQSSNDPGVDLNSLDADLFSGASQNWAYLAFDDKKS